MTVRRETPSGVQYGVTVPRHRYLKVGTLDGIVGDVAKALDLPKD